jgi:hypothetical protein
MLTGVDRPVFLPMLLPNKVNFVKNRNGTEYLWRLRAVVRDRIEVRSDRRRVITEGRTGGFEWCHRTRVGVQRAVARRGGVVTHVSHYYNSPTDSSVRRRRDGCTTILHSGYLQLSDVDHGADDCCSSTSPRRPRSRAPHSVPPHCRCVPTAGGGATRATPEWTPTRRNTGRLEVGFFTAGRCALQARDLRFRVAHPQRRPSGATNSTTNRRP